jgi:DNA topoisomerase IB
MSPAQLYDFISKARVVSITTLKLMTDVLPRIIKRCQELPGHELFQYFDDDGQPQTIDSGDVNNYLREITNEDFTAKDFRTWAGTVMAARELRQWKALSHRLRQRRMLCKRLNLWQVSWGTALLLVEILRTSCQ